MKLLEHIERINRLHELIRYRRTGTPPQLARKLKLSTSMVYKILDELKLRDVPIAYSRQLKTYYYAQSYSMKITLEFRALRDDELTDFHGGYLYTVN